MAFLRFCKNILAFWSIARLVIGVFDLPNDETCLRVSIKRSEQVCCLGGKDNIEGLSSHQAAYQYLYLWRYQRAEKTWEKVISSILFWSGENYVLILVLLRRYLSGNQEMHIFWSRETNRKGMITEMSSLAFKQVEDGVNFSKQIHWVFLLLATTSLSFSFLFILNRDHQPLVKPARHERLPFALPVDWHIKVDIRGRLSTAWSCTVMPLFALQSSSHS